MHRFEKSFITEWRRLGLPFENATVVVAVSGGADSLSLLLATHRLRELKKLDLRIVAAHLNHALRGNESDRDEQFVREITSDLKIEFASERAKPFPQGNLEQNARAARYQFLSKIAASVDAFAIVTGHTINDQAETFLINLIRGSGPDGLSGMKPITDLEFEAERSNFAKTNTGSEVPRRELKVIRPLLTWAKRAETEAFCRDLGIEYCCDTMNEDTAFKRVRIRKILLPLLEDFNPNIIEVLANTSFLLARSQINSDIENRIDDADELQITDLKDLSENELFEIIRKWLTGKRGNSRRLGLKHIKGVARLALSMKSGRMAEVPGGRVIKTGGRLRYEENKVEKKGSDI